MANFNQVTLLGNVVKDPDIRTTGGGTNVANFRMAVNSSYGKGDDKKEETLFIEVTCWAGLADIVKKYLNKGDPVLISGRLVLREWKDRDDNEQKTIEVNADKIQLLGGKRDGGDQDRDEPRGRNRDRGRDRDRDDQEPREGNKQRGEREERERNSSKRNGRGRDRDDRDDRDDRGDRDRGQRDPW